MSVVRVMVGGRVKRDGEHGGRACGGFRLADQTRKVDGCPARWGFISGAALLATLCVRSQIKNMAKQLEGTQWCRWAATMESEAVRAGYDKDAFWHDVAYKAADDSLSVEDAVRKILRASRKQAAKRAK